MQRKHLKTIEALYSRPTSGNIRWADIVSLFKALGAETEEREGSRIAAIFPGYMPAVFHRPHPSPMTDKGAVTTIRNWLKNMGIRP
ncbi:MAG: type II toxin-antitoxin system HicA family toxin [bacterium]|nr:type II toxin-antitoxin system HicA family toxin [bacterium]